MQMRAGGLAAVPEPSEHIPSTNMIVQPHLYASVLQVRIRHVAIGGNLQNDMVSRNVIECDWGQDPRCIVRYSIRHFRDLSVRHGEDRFSPAPPVVVLIEGCTVMTRIAVGADFDPVNCETFSRINVAVNRCDGTAMGGVVRRAIPG